MSKTNGMSDYDLGDIKRVDDLRSVWKHEASDFTRWLADEENLNLLSEAVDMRIRLVETEASVGSFSVDILAEDELTQTKVVIENQLEPTNHDHLGKVITYASGVDARVAIWIVREAREEHQRAIDWLNEHTDDSLAFFLVQIELWQIDNSKKAPRFEIISKPNEWAKAAKQSVAGDGENRFKYLNFWEQFKEYTKTRNTKLKLPKPANWYIASVDIGNRRDRIDFVLYKGAVVTRLFVELKRRDLFYFLEGQKDSIENDLGFNVTTWREYKSCNLIQAEHPCDWVDSDKREDYFEWLLRTGEKFQDVFPKYLKQYYDQGGE